MAESTVCLNPDTPLCPAGSGHPSVTENAYAALIEGLRCAADGAYETLIAEFQQPVFNLVSRLVDDPEDACDVVQEVFIKVFRNIGSFRGQSSLKTWIYRIAVNEANNQRRWFRRHKHREIGLWEEDEGRSRSYGDVLPDPRRSPYDLAISAETQGLLEEALVRLNPNFRAAVVLRDVEDLSYEEIASVLGLSLGTVKSRILRGREALRKALSERLQYAHPFGWAPQTAGQD